jgi:hypothetical protein
VDLAKDRHTLVIVKRISPLVVIMLAAAAALAILRKNDDQEEDGVWKPVRPT